jgi:hypothetical protein
MYNTEIHVQNRKMNHYNCGFLVSENSSDIRTDVRLMTRHEPQFSRIPYDNDADW